LIKAWLVVLVCGVGGGVLFSLLWIGVLRFCAGVMAWASILLVNLALVGITLFCYAKAGKIQGQAIAQHFNTDLPPALDPSDSDKKVFLVVAYVMTALSVGMFVITLVLFRRIRIAVACLKVGSQAVGAMPLLMLFPLLPFALLLALIAYWVAVAAFLYR
jgi:choline transporter-like protein 2/4/5